jgi:excisionase family DNA binding protein
MNYFATQSQRRYVLSQVSLGESLSHSFRATLPMAQSLRYTEFMEATQGHPNLLSEKQAAKRLGVARITLLRAREAGRIKFFRIGTRVLYCAEQLSELLNSCERNGHKRNQAKKREGEVQAARKDNRVSAGRGSAKDRERAGPQSKSEPRKKDQVSLPFATSR